MIVGYAPGAFDLFHVGHLNLIRRAKLACDYLIVGVVTDELYQQIRGTSPIVPFGERLAIVRQVSIVDAAIGEPFQDKRSTWDLVRFDVLVKGDDWLNKPEAHRQLGRLSEVGVDVQFVPYTKRTCSSRIREVIRQSPQESSSSLEHRAGASL